MHIRSLLSEPRQPMTTILSRVVLALGVILPIVGGAYAAWRVSERSGFSQSAAVVNERLELYAATLEAELARFAYLPGLIAAESTLQDLLDAPGDPALRERVRRGLVRVAARAGASRILVIGPDNALLASSTAERTTSGVLSALFPARGQADQTSEAAVAFFAANDGDGSTDYYFVQPVLRHERSLGHVIVKINLAPLEATWIDLGLRTQSERLLVVDENEVVVMSSVPAWKYRTAGPAAQGAPTGRYAAASLAPLNLQAERQIEPGVSLVKVPGQDGRGLQDFLAQERPIAPLGARLLALSDPSEVHRHARTAAWGGGAGGALLSLLLLYGLHRRRILRQLVQTRNALQQTHDQLERQVDERTWQLRSANEELQRQIDQRVQAESELMQAGKLAVLGQMSAGISHEINQPLTALRALSRNALQFLEIGRTREVAGNLQSIDEMAERMGRIVNQLKSFARKEGAGQAAVDLAGATRNVLLMLDHRLRTEPVDLHLDIPEGVRVLVDSNRLEQVLLNLVGNALDAMADATTRELRIAALARPDGRIAVQISDTGQGMSEAQMAHLFEPFFTTKAAGQGLGLGLVISSKIVGEFGGTLRAQRGEVGMLFEFDLAAAEECHV